MQPDEAPGKVQKIDCAEESEFRRATMSEMAKHGRVDGSTRTGVDKGTLKVSHARHMLLKDGIIEAMDPSKVAAATIGESSAITRARSRFCENIPLKETGSRTDRGGDPYSISKKCVVGPEHSLHAWEKCKRGSRILPNDGTVHEANPISSDLPGNFRVNTRSAHAQPDGTQLSSPDSDSFLESNRHFAAGDKLLNLNSKITVARTAHLPSTDTGTGSETISSSSRTAESQNSSIVQNACETIGAPPFRRQNNKECQPANGDQPLIGNEWKKQFSQACNLEMLKSDSCESPYLETCDDAATNTSRLYDSRQRRQNIDKQGLTQLTARNENVLPPVPTSDEAHPHLSSEYFNDISTTNSSSSFAVNERSVALSLAGPFVQGVILGSPNAFERLEGDHCVCANEVTSKLLLSVVGRASNDPVPSNGGSTVDISDLDSGMSTVVVPLASLGDIAEELVQDRRLMTREAVRFAFIEMTKRHHAMTNNNALTRSESASDHSSRSHSKDQLRQLEGEIKRLQEEHEKEAKKWRNEKDNIINEMIRRHQAEIVAMREKATQQQDDFTLRLDSYKKASCQAIGHLWKKNRKRPFC